MRPAVGLLLFYKEKSEENENMKNYKIAVAGTGYVGLSLSVLLAQHSGCCKSVTHRLKFEKAELSML